MLRRSKVSHISEIGSKVVHISEVPRIFDEYQPYSEQSTISLSATSTIPTPPIRQDLCICRYGV